MITFEVRCCQATLLHQPVSPDVPSMRRSRQCSNKKVVFPLGVCVAAQPRAREEPFGSRTGAGAQSSWPGESLPRSTRPSLPRNPEGVGLARAEPKRTEQAERRSPRARVVFERRPPPPRPLVKSSSSPSLRDPRDPQEPMVPADFPSTLRRGAPSREQGRGRGLKGSLHDLVEHLDDFGLDDVTDAYLQVPTIAVPAKAQKATQKPKQGRFAAPPRRGPSKKHRYFAEAIPAELADASSVRLADTCFAPYTFFWGLDRAR